MLDLNKYKIFSCNARGGKGTLPNEVSRVVQDITFPNGKGTHRYLKIVIGDDIIHNLGWKVKDRISIFQSKEDKNQFCLLKSETGSMLRTNQGFNIRTYHLQTNADGKLDLMGFLTCKSFEIAQVESKEDVIKCLVINL